jgi:UDP-glucuronate decarboxylase
MLASDIDEIVTRLHEHGIAEAFTGKNVVLTGARGFLGRHLVEVFARLPCKLIALDKYDLADKLGAGPARLKDRTEPGMVEMVNHDVTEIFNPMARGGVTGVDFILSLSGIASPVHYKTFPLETMDVSYFGTRNMLKLAIDYGAKILVASSSEIYGDPDPGHIPTSEDYRGNVDCRGERAPYDEGKRAAETLCWIYARHRGAQVKVVRPFNCYGPGLSQKDHRVLSRFAGAIVSGRPLQVFGTGNQSRTFCYLTDMLVGMLLVLVKGKAGEAYNVGNPYPEINVFHLALELEKVAGRDMEQFPIQFVPAPSQYVEEPQRRCPDITKLKNDTGYKPTVTLQAGLGRFLDWAEKNYVVEP